eukprot:gene13993-18766_t
MQANFAELIEATNELLQSGEISAIKDISKNLDSLDQTLSLDRRNLLESRGFCELYVKLLDRIFGEDVTQVSDTLGSLSTGWVRGNEGGWLRRLNMSSSPIISSPNRHRRIDKINKKTVEKFGWKVQCENSLSPLCNELLPHFFPNSDLMHLLDQSNSQITLSMLLLPDKLQYYLTNNNNNITTINSENHSALVRLIRFPVSNQKRIVASVGFQTSQQSNTIDIPQSVLVHATEYFMICLARYPTLNDRPFSSSSSGTTATLFDGNSLMREKTNLGSLSTSNSDDSNQFYTLLKKGIFGWILGCPYLTILEYYFDEFLSISEGSINVSNHTTVRREVYRELLLRLAIEYWMDIAMVIRMNHGAVADHRRNGSGSPMSGGRIGRDHPHPTEVMMLDFGSLKFTPGMMQCTYLLLSRLLCDPALLIYYNQYLYGSNGNIGSNGIKASYTSSSAVTISPLRVLQQPLFDMLRSIFSSGDAVAMDAQVIILAVEIWLLYIQPWNASLIRNEHLGLDSFLVNTTNIPSEWKPHVAANLHFYTTLLSIYLKMISKTHLSFHDTEGLMKLQSFGRVLKAFSPALVASIDDYNSYFQVWYPSHLNPLGASMDDVFDGSLGNNNISIDEMKLMKMQHQYLFPDRSIERRGDYGITDFRETSEEVGNTIASNIIQATLEIDSNHGFLMKIIHFLINYIMDWIGWPRIEVNNRDHKDYLNNLLEQLLILIPNIIIPGSTILNQNEDNYEKINSNSTTEQEV